MPLSRLPSETITEILHCTEAQRISSNTNQRFFERRAVTHSLKTSHAAVYGTCRWLRDVVIKAGYVSWALTISFGPEGHGQGSPFLDAFFEEVRTSLQNFRNCDIDIYASGVEFQAHPNFMWPAVYEIIVPYIHRWRIFQGSYSNPLDSSPLLSFYTDAVIAAPRLQLLRLAAHHNWNNEMAPVVDLKMETPMLAYLNLTGCSIDMSQASPQCLHKLCLYPGGRFHVAPFLRALEHMKSLRILIISATSLAWDDWDFSPYSHNYQRIETGLQNLYIFASLSSCWDFLSCLYLPQLTSANLAESSEEIQTPNPFEVRRSYIPIQCPRLQYIHINQPLSLVDGIIFLSGIDMPHLRSLRLKVTDPGDWLEDDEVLSAPLALPNLQIIAFTSTYKCPVRAVLKFMQYLNIPNIIDLSINHYPLNSNQEDERVARVALVTKSIPTIQRIQLHLSSVSECGLFFRHLRSPPLLPQLTLCITSHFRDIASTSWDRFLSSNPGALVNVTNLHFTLQFSLASIHFPHLPNLSCLWISVNWEVASLNMLDPLWKVKQRKTRSGKNNTPFPRLSALEVKWYKYTFAPSRSYSAEISDEERTVWTAAIKRMTEKRVQSSGVLSRLSVEPPVEPAAEELLKTRAQHFTMLNQTCGMRMSRIGGRPA